MSSILKFFRITFFLVLYFILCMVAVTIMLQGWPVGGQMLFALGVPVILIWWQEKRRSRKAVTEGSSETRTSPPEPISHPSVSGNRIESERIREDNVPKASAVAQAHEPPKRNLPDSVRREKEAIQEQRERAEHHRTHANERRRERQRELEERRRQERERAHSEAVARRSIDTKLETPTKSLRDGWFPLRETASVAGRDIGGMVYVGTPPLLNTYGYRDKCRAYIDPSLSVARSGAEKAGEGMPYWPGYSDITPQCRAT